MPFASRMSLRRRKPAAMALVLSLFAVGLLPGCAVTSTDARIVALTPSVLQQGKATSVAVQVEHWTPDTQLVLIPAGPYVTHQLALSSSPTAMVADASRTFIATADGQLSVIDFPPENSVPRVLSRFSFTAPATRLAYADGRLLVLLDDDRLQWLDVASSAPPKLLATLSSPGKVADIQLVENAVYLLLEDDDGSMLQRWGFIDGVSPQLEKQWPLPVATTSFVLRGQHIWTVGPTGLAVSQISDKQLVLKDAFATSGIASDVQLQNELALVADGRGGLQVFDISNPAQLQWRGSFNKRGAIRGFSLSQGAASENSALLSLQNGALLRLGLGNPELPSSGAAFVPDGPVLASALRGDVALLATEHSLQRVMMVGDGDGAISPEGLNLGGSRRGIFGTGSRDNILFVADWFSGLHLYDISNPRQLRHLGNYHTPGSSKGVTLLGNYALVGDDDQGLQIIDIKDPRQPRWISELPPEAMAKLGLAYTMKLVGNILYLADHRGGFHIIDLSDIKHPQRLGGYDTPGKAWDIDVHDNVAFVADDRGGLLMFDVSNSAKPEPFAQFNPGGQAEAVSLQNGRAYVAFFDKGLYVLDVSNPRDAKVLGHTPIPGNARGLELGDGLIYVASWEAGLQVVDIRDANAPRIIGHFDTDGAAWGVKVKGDYAYVLDWWGGIKVVDVREPTRPTYVSQYHARGTLQQLRTKNTYLYAASGVAGLQVYDIKNPLNPIWVTGVDVPGQSQGLWLEDDRAYLAAGDGGVFIFDTLDPFYTRQTGSIKTPGDATHVVVGNEYLYIADSKVGLLVMDVRDPQQAVEVARYDLPARDLWLDEQTLWLVSEAGLSGWNVADDGRLSPAVSVSGEFVSVRAQDDVLVASTQAGDIMLWRFVGQGLEKLGQIVSGGAVSGLQMHDDLLYFLNADGELSTVDISQPSSPKQVAIYPATGNHNRLVIARGAAFLAGEKKLASVTLLPTITATVKDAGELSLRIPAELPRGEYHLLAVGLMGQRQLLPNALKLQFAAPGKKNVTLDAFRQLLKTPLKPPPEIQTELPSSQ